jgi:hypothetical protein
MVAKLGRSRDVGCKDAGNDRSFEAERGSSFEMLFLGTQLLSTPDSTVSTDKDPEIVFLLCMGQETRGMHFQSARFLFLRDTLPVCWLSFMAVTVTFGRSKAVFIGGSPLFRCRS